MNLTTRLTIVFLILSIIPMGIVGYLAYDRGKESLTDDAFEYLETIESIKTAQLREWGEDAANSSKSMAADPVFKAHAVTLASDTIDLSDYETSYAAVVDDYIPKLKSEGFKDLQLLRASDGMVLASTNKAEEGEYRSNRSYFINGERTFFMGQSDYYPESASSVLTLSLPIEGEGNSTVAVLAGSIDMEELMWVLIQISTLGRAIDIYLVDAANIFATDPWDQGGLVGRNVALNSEAMKVLTDGDGTGLYRDYRGMSVIGAYNWLPEWGLGIVTEIEQSEALAPVRDLRNTMLAIGGGIAAMVVILALFFSRTITRPLRRLYQGAVEIGKGNFDYEIATHTKDEIGGLSRAFDQMVHSLKETTVSRDELAGEVVKRKDAQEEMEAYRMELEASLEELKIAYEQLRELDQMKDTFLSTVSHELRTPLTSIKSFAEILLTYEDDDPETRREFLGIINDESDRLTRLINDFLDLARIEAGRMQWNTSEVGIKGVVQSAVNAVQGLAAAKNLHFEVDIAEELPMVSTDQDRLIQVVTNLLSNAIKFTPEEGLIKVVTETIAGTGERPGQVKVSVIDNGIGISPEDQEAVFEKFRQVGDTLKDKPQGTGLGLPICKEIIEHYQGRLWVESEPDKGSTFSFTLPALDKLDSVTDRQSERDTEHDKVSRPINSGRGSTVLVVEDEENIRRFLSHELSQRGFKVIEASGGKEAIDLAREHVPDLITLDVLMPDLTGFDVTAVLKSDEKTKDIPILIVSVMEDREKAKDLGVNDYLTKPFEVESLFEKVDSLMQKKQKSVLVVDDDRPLTRSVEYELQKRGLTVRIAYDGKQALEMIGQDRPDMIVLDVIMPELNGYEVAKVLKGDPETAGIPIVLMTGVEIDGGRVQALSLGVDEYLTKSGGLSKLLEAIEKILKNGGSPENY